MKKAQPFKADPNFTYRFGTKPFHKALAEIEKKAPRTNAGKFLYDGDVQLAELARQVGLKSKGLTPIKRLLDGKNVAHTTAAIAHAWNPTNTFKAEQKNGNHRPPSRPLLEELRRRGIAKYGIVPYPGLTGYDLKCKLGVVARCIQEILQFRGVRRFQHVYLDNYDAQIRLRRDLDFVIGGSPLAEIKNSMPSFHITNLSIGMLAHTTAPKLGIDKISYIIGSEEASYIKTSGLSPDLFEGYSCPSRPDQYFPLFKKVFDGRAFAAIGPKYLISAFMCLSATLNPEKQFQEPNGKGVNSLSIYSHLSSGKPLRDANGKAVELLSEYSLSAWMNKYAPQWEHLWGHNIPLLIQPSEKRSLYKTQPLINWLDEIKKDKKLGELFFVGPLFVTQSPYWLPADALDLFDEPN